MKCTILPNHFKDKTILKVEQQNQIGRKEQKEIKKTLFINEKLPLPRKSPVACLLISVAWLCMLCYRPASPYFPPDLCDLFPSWISQTPSPTTFNRTYAFVVLFLYCVRKKQLIITIYIWPSSELNILIFSLFTFFSLYVMKCSSRSSQCTLHISWLSFISCICFYFFLYTYTHTHIWLPVYMYVYMYH